MRVRLYISSSLIFFKELVDGSYSRSIFQRIKFEPSKRILNTVGIVLFLLCSIHNLKFDTKNI